MTRSNPLVQLLYAAEAAGYATVGSCETAAEWDAALISRRRRRPGARFVPGLVAVSSTLMMKLLSVLLVAV